jgi:oligopeptide/dipeptide ABC transporter ATP-binding protein
MPALLEAQNVSKVFGSGASANVALDHFTLTLNDDTPSFTSVAGESGSGKTTLARLLLGFAEPSDGQVLYRGRDLRRLSRGDIMHFRQEVQAIFQDPFEVFNPFYKVDHLLRMPIVKFKLATSRAAARTQIEEALNAVGLRPEETLGRYPHQLSGGQRQRLTIARALLFHPRLIIADEPVSMVDASLRATILESLKKLHTDFGISFVYITHDLTTAYQISDNIIVLYRGSVAEVGEVDQVIKEPKHPYSQLLIASIPQPDPGMRWGGDQVVRQPASSRSATHGCKFAGRCPAVMDMCWEQVPPLYRTERYSAASCFLHREAPAIALDQMDQVLVPRGQLAGAAPQSSGSVASGTA